MESSIESLIQKLIDSKHQMVLYVAGVGCKALHWMTQFPRSTSFALEGGNFYATGSLEILLNMKIPKYVTQSVAEEMAQEALIKGHQILRQIGDTKPEHFAQCVGVGLTGAIRSTTERRNLHHAYLCFHFMNRRYNYHIVLDKTGTRFEEEEYISFKLYDILVQHIYCEPIKLPPQITPVEQNDMMDLFQLLVNKPKRFFNILIDAQGGVQLNSILDNSVVLSGSFNPLHQGHLDIANRTADICKIPRERVYFELSIINADKGSICSDQILRRVQQFAGFNLILSTRPLFKDKNIFLTNGAFSIGADTYKRLIDTKYYSNSTTERDVSFVEFLKNNNRIVVAPRLNEVKGEIESLPDFEIPPLIMKHVVEIKGFRNDISSTTLRQQRARSHPPLLMSPKQ